MTKGTPVNIYTGIRAERMTARLNANETLEDMQKRVQAAVDELQVRHCAPQFCWVQWRHVRAELPGRLVNYGPSSRLACYPTRALASPHPIDRVARRFRRSRRRELLRAHRRAGPNRPRTPRPSRGGPSRRRRRQSSCLHLRLGSRPEQAARPSRWRASTCAELRARTAIARATRAAVARAARGARAAPAARVARSAPATLLSPRTQASAIMSASRSSPPRSSPPRASRISPRRPRQAQRVARQAWRRRLRRATGASGASGC